MVAKSIRCVAGRNARSSLLRILVETLRRRSWAGIGFCFVANVKGAILQGERPRLDYGLHRQTSMLGSAILIHNTIVQGQPRALLEVRRLDRGEPEFVCVLTVAEGGARLVKKRQRGHGAPGEFATINSPVRSRDGQSCVGVRNG